MAWWKALGGPALPPQVQKTLIDSVHTEIGSRSIEALEEERGALLLGLLELRQRGLQAEPYEIGAPV